MKNQEQKLTVLKEIMGLMDDQMIGAAKKRKSPDMADTFTAGLQDRAAQEPDLMETEETPELPVESEDVTLDEDMMRKLIEMREQEDQTL